MRLGRLVAVSARRARALSSVAAPTPLARLGRVAAASLVAAGTAAAYLHERESIHANLSADRAEDVDALIIGGGIMGTTVAVMLKLLQPAWNVRLVEQLDRVGAESSNEWHNAGTGHAALCEANYTPTNPQTGEIGSARPSRSTKSSWSACRGGRGWWRRACCRTDPSSRRHRTSSSRMARTA